SLRSLTRDPLDRNSGSARRWHPEVLESRRRLELVEPVEADGLHQAAVDDDDSRIGRAIVESLVGAVRRYIDEVTGSPLELLGLLLPLPDEFVLASKLDVVVQIVAVAFDDESDFLRKVPGRSGRAIWRNELHIDINAALLRIHALVDDVLYQSVGRALHRHLVPLDDVLAIAIVAAERIRSCQCLRVKVRSYAAARPAPLRFVNERCVRAHSVFLVIRSVTASREARSPRARVPVPSAGTRPSSE